MREIRVMAPVFMSTWARYCLARHDIGALLASHGTGVAADSGSRAGVPPRRYAVAGWHLPGVVPKPKLRPRSFASE